MWFYAGLPIYRITGDTTHIYLEVTQQDMRPLYIIHRKMKSNLCTVWGPLTLLIYNDVMLCNF